MCVCVYVCVLLLVLSAQVLFSYGMVVGMTVKHERWGEKAQEREREGKEDRVKKGSFRRIKSNRTEALDFPAGILSLSLLLSLSPSLSLPLK